MDGVVHFEVPLENIERGTEFYKKVFEWGVEKAGEMPYWMARTSECDEKQMPKELGKINGGFYEKGDGEASNNPVIVIKVKDMDESIKKIQENGGSITLEKNQVGDMGLYAQFKDTENNIMGLWQDLK